MKKIILNLILVIGFAIWFMPTDVHAQTVEADSYSFNTDTGKLYIKNDGGTTAWREDPNIEPEAVKSVEFARIDTPVLNIGAGAFEGCINLTSPIKLNAQTASLGADAFKDCESLDLVLIPETVQNAVEASGLPNQVAYVIYAYDTDTFNFFVKDVHYGSQSQIQLPDNYIHSGEWSCSGIYLICEDKFQVLPAEKGGLAWYYHTETDGEVTVTGLRMSTGYRSCIELPEKFGNLVIKQYADDAFSNAGLTAANILFVDEGIKVNVPKEISKVVCVTENGEKVAYLTQGTLGTFDASILRQLYLPNNVKTLFAKDIMLESSDIDMIEGAAVSYEEKENGEIIITNVVLSRFGFKEYVVPVSVEGKTVTTVMINSKYNPIGFIVVDGSMNKIIYEYDSYGSGGSPVITQIVQGSGQIGIEIPADIGGYPVADVPVTAFDESVECICVPEGLKVTRPEDVCEIIYMINADGLAVVTKITPGTDENGTKKEVNIPETIDGKKVILSDEVKTAMKNIPHAHKGGTATCRDQAVCSICQSGYGELDKTNHVSETVLKNQKSATCTEEGYTGDTVCAGCGEMLKTGTRIAKLSHNYKDGICTMCGASETNHQDATQEDKNSGNVSSPRTGDETPIVLWIGILVVACVAILGIVVYRKKQKKN